MVEYITTNMKLHIPDSLLRIFRENKFYVISIGIVALIPLSLFLFSLFSNLDFEGGKEPTPTPVKEFEEDENEDEEDKDEDPTPTKKVIRSTPTSTKTLPTNTPTEAPTNTPNPTNSPSPTATPAETPIPTEGLPIQNP